MVQFTTIVLGGLTVGTALFGYRRYKESRLRLPEYDHVVIVGAGYAGVSLADKIHGKGHYTIIDPRDSLHHNMGALRASIQPGFANKTFVPYEPKFGNHFKQGKVVGIDTETNTVKLAGEEDPVNYTHLVFATGSSGPFPGKCDYNESVSSLIKKYEDYAQVVKKANRIVVIGGGAVGVEMASEIASDYPEKSVTMIHNGDTLVTKKLAPKALDAIEARLAELKVNVIRGETVEMKNIPLNVLKQNLVIKTSSGREVETDLVIPCVGMRVNNEAYADSLPDKMNRYGALMVDDNLQVKGLRNVYAIGDCNDLPVGKLAMEGAFQAWHMWENLASGSPAKPYKENTFRMIVPLGRNGGIMQNGSWVLGDWAAKRMKSRDVFVPMVWRAMGQVPPKE